MTLTVNHSRTCEIVHFCFSFTDVCPNMSTLKFNPFPLFFDDPVTALHFRAYFFFDEILNRIFLSFERTTLSLSLKSPRKVTGGDKKKEKKR